MNRYMEKQVHFFLQIVELKKLALYLFWYKVNLNEEHLCKKYKPY